MDTMSNILLIYLMIGDSGGAFSRWTASDRPVPGVRRKPPPAADIDRCRPRRFSPPAAEHFRRAGAAADSGPFLFHLHGGRVVETEGPIVVEP